MEKESFYSKYKSIVVFLILELIALLSFNFANIKEVFFGTGIIISAIAFLFAFKTSEDKKGYLKLLPVLAVLLFVSGILGFGGFSNSFTKISNIIVFLAIPAFFALGFFTRRLKEIKIEYVLLAIGFGFAAVCLFGIFATWINYGPFYSLIYKIKGTTDYYYNGAPFDVTKEMSWLVGFSFTEVTIDYGGLISSICAAYLPALLFINKKENKNTFISVATIGGIGVISLLSIPNFAGLIIVLVASVFAFIYKFLKSHQKVTKVIGYSFFAIIGLGVLFFLFAVINAASGFKFGGFLNRIFVSNGIMQGPSEVLRAAFDKTSSGYLYNLFGFDMSYEGLGSSDIYLESIIFNNTGIFEIQIIKEVGVFGSIVFVLFVCAMIYFVIRYLKNSKDSDVVKNLVVLILLVFFAYSSIRNEIVPQTHNNSYEAFLRSAPLMIILFVMGLIYEVPEEKAKEETK